jgi:hypothetical protein
VLSKLLMDHGPVVVDASALTVSWPSAVMVFPSTLAQAGGWPWARLVLFKTQTATESALRARCIDQAIPLASTWQQATFLIKMRPRRVSRTTDMPDGREAGILARSAVAEACADWDIDPLTRGAKLVVTELVTNAVEHAHTPSTLVLAFSPLGLHIAVCDGAAVNEADRQSLEALASPGWGLRLVAGLAAHWGVRSHPAGKTVWAILPPPPVAALAGPLAAS